MAFLDKYLQPGKKPTLPKPFKPAAPTNLQSPATPQMSTGSTQRNLSGLAGRILPGLNTQPKTTGFNPVADTQTKLGMSPNVPNQSSVSLESLQAANNARRAALAPPTVPSAPLAPTVPPVQDDANANALAQLKREAEQIRTTGSAVAPAAPTGQSEQDRLLQQLSDSNPEFADQIMDKLGYTGSPNLITSADVQGKNQPAVSENRQRLEALREAYSKTLEAPQTSDTERSLEEISKQMANLSASEQLGLNKIKDQPIVLDLLRGQEAALQRGVLGQMGALEAQAVPLQTRLEQEQARRLAAQKQKEVELGFAQEDVKSEQPIEVGGSLVNPKTGEVIYKGEGTKPQPTASIQEYEYAKKGGYKGTFTDYQNEDANRKNKLASAGLDASSPLVSAVIANPELFNQLTATDKAALAPALNALGFSSFGKPLSDTAIKEITQTETAIEQLNALKDTVKNNLQYIGPISGLSALNPYSKARQVQADIDRVKQNVGKALEGGVLRKEDEEKYKKILATMTDTPDTAEYKLNQLIAQLTADIERYKGNQSLAGRNVSVSATGTSDFTW